MVLTTYILVLICLSTIWAKVRSYQLPLSNKPTPTPYHDWDYLMFSQRWPITSCAIWEEKKPANTCKFPSDRMQWNVHGIWPTKRGTEGPLFCPSAIHFDPNQLVPLLDQLNEHWTNIENNTKEFSFWKHEWDKHGTCAVSLPELNSIPNYFLQGLDWIKVQNLSEILIQDNIIPGPTGYTADQIAQTVKSATKHDPIIQCVVDPHTKESMISEIRLCFDKSLEIIDCDPEHSSNSNNETTTLTNCSTKKPVMYLDTLPTNSIMYEMDYIDKLLRASRSYSSYLEFYKLIKFLIWFSI